MGFGRGVPITTKGKGDSFPHIDKGQTGEGLRIGILGRSMLLTPPFDPSKLGSTKPLRWFF